MIRRFIAASTVLTASLLALGAAQGSGVASAHHDGDYIACAYKHTPVDFGVCVSWPL